MLFPDIKCVGIQHRPPECKLIASVARQDIGGSVTLEREPTNEFDSNAIKVMYEGYHIGYIAGDSAAWIAPQIDEEQYEEIEATIIDEIPFGRSGGFHLLLNINFIEPSPV